MKSIQIALIAICVLLLAACQTDGNLTDSLTTGDAGIISEELSVSRITDGVLLVNHRFPWEANSLVVEMKNADIVLIDTPYTDEATKELVDWITNQVGTERNIVAVNTGYHFDNLGGNGYLIKNGIQVYGTSQTVNLIHQNGENSRKWFLENLKAPQYQKYFKAFEALEYVNPSEVISIDKDQEMVLSFGTERLHLYYPGESHAPDNVVVYYPEKKVLFGGCMVKELNASNLGNTSEANLTEWHASIKKLKEKYPTEQVAHVIPGHGQVGDIQLLDHTLQLLEQ